MSKIDELSIKDIVDDIFTTYSVRKRRKDIVAFYCQKFQADLFDEENGDLTASEDIIAKRIDTILKEDKLPICALSPFQLHVRTLMGMSENKAAIEGVAFRTHEILDHFYSGLT